jgi:hypothetical protein
MSYKPEAVPQQLRDDCRVLWGGFLICIGDYVEVYPRGVTRYIGHLGRIVQLTDSAMVLETKNNNLVIRYSEIRMIRKYKPEELNKEKPQTQ